MHYELQFFDTFGRRAARITETPLLEVVRDAPDARDTVRGLLPMETASGVGWRVRVLLEERLVCEAVVTRVAPQWGERRKLILDRYVNFRELLAFEAQSPLRHGNRRVRRSFVHTRVDEMVRSLINTALGPVHYWVEHTAYPDGAEREHAKFLARKLPENELEVGGIDAGQWVGAARMELSGAYAKDGDTIAGILVDGAPWPDLRLMLIDAEELTRNSHAIKRHPEVAFWTDAEYAASGYKRRADAATDFLQHLLDTHGIDFIELNPHRDHTGAFDDRVDAFGRYLGFAHGNAQCYNAALVEQGHADVYLYQEGRFNVPEMALKDFFSYTGVHTDSIAVADAVLRAFHAEGGVLEMIGLLAYAAGGFAFAVDPELGVHFRAPEEVAGVVHFREHETTVTWGVQRAGLANLLVVRGHPLLGAVEHTAARGESIDTFGMASRGFDCFALAHADDAAALAEALLDDVAYPELDAVIDFAHGHVGFAPGELAELRDGPVQRMEPELAQVWGGRHAGRLIGRVRTVRHRFAGRQVSTKVLLTSPPRSVGNPLQFVLRGQPRAHTLFGFRLDDATVALDAGFRLD